MKSFKISAGRDGLSSVTIKFIAVIIVSICSSVCQHSSKVNYLILKAGIIMTCSDENS